MSSPDEPVRSRERITSSRHHEEDVAPGAWIVYLGSMRLIAFAPFLGVASFAVGLWCCSDSAQRPPVLGSVPRDGSAPLQDGSASDAATSDSTPPSNGDGGCLVTVTGARMGTFVCKTTSFHQVFAAEAGQVWAVDPLAVVALDPQVPSSVSKVTGFSVRENQGPKTGTYTCDCGYGEVGQDGGQVSQWGQLDKRGNCTLRVDSVVPSGPPEFIDANASTITPMTVHGTASCEAPDIWLDGGLPPVRIEGRF